MKKCDSCGNEYDKCFELSIQGRTYTFDSFECAIYKAAPRCEHCGVSQIICPVFLAPSPLGDHPRSI